MPEPKNTPKRGDQVSSDETEVSAVTAAPADLPVAIQENTPEVAPINWKYVGPEKAASIRFEGDPRLLKANKLSNDEVNRLIAESPRAQAWYEKA